MKVSKAVVSCMPIMVQKGLHIDGFGEGTLILEVVYSEKKCHNEFTIDFLYDNRRKKKSLRRFESCLRAVRSFRRYVLLSDEVKMGFGV